MNSPLPTNIPALLASISAVLDLDVPQGEESPTNLTRMFVKDCNSIYLYLNDHYASELGVAAEDAIGRSDHDFFPEELACRYQADDSQVISQGVAVHMEEPYQLSGGMRWIRTIKAPLRDTDGTIIGIIGVFRDITEYVALMADAHRKKKLLAETESLARIGSWDYDLVDDRLYWSDEVYRICDQQPWRFSPSYQGFMELIHPDDRDRVDRTFRASTSSEPQGMIEHRIVLPDGRIKHVTERWRIEFFGDQPRRAVGTLQDFTEQKKDESKIQLLNWTLEALTRCNAALIRASSESDLMESICQSLTGNDIFLLAWIGAVRHDEARSIAILASHGRAASYVEDFTVSWGDGPFGQGPTGRAVRTGMAQVMEDIETETAFTPWRDKSRLAGIVSSMCLPVTIGGQIEFVLSVYSAHHRAFGLREQALIRQFADDLGYGIESRRLTIAYESERAARLRQAEMIEGAMENVIGALSATLEQRDPYTTGHEQRVSALAVAIGRELGMDEDRLRGLGLGALVHDLGKVQIPIEILTKPGRLSRIEYELIKTHPTAGYEILKDLKFPWPIADMVIQHHEYLDGSGYPRGLHASEIRLESRILSVADIVESMSSDRPYRPQLGIAEALAEIQRQRGVRLDPEVVDACVRLFQEKRFDWAVPTRMHQPA